MVAEMPPFRHGADHLPVVTVDTYNTELRDSEGFLGDRANKRAFEALVEDWRERLRRIGQDPFGDTPTAEMNRWLDEILLKGDPESAGLLLGALEEFAQELAGVVRRFLCLEEWRDTQAIVVGGGLRASRIGELAIGRSSVLLKADGHDLGLRPIRHHPDEAGLIGCVQLAPVAVFQGYDAILAVDIGGSKIRAGIVALELKQADLSAAHVVDSKVWRHADERPNRDEAVDRLAAMLKHFVGRAQDEGLRLAPFIGIACPGLIRADGRIERGGQNLPGDWEADDFNLPERISRLIPTIGDRETTVLVHNDAVVQGLSEAAYTGDVAHWGVLTIGTGLGNARFSRRSPGA
jgi:hypothetical protein